MRVHLHNSLAAAVALGFLAGACASLSEVESRVDDSLAELFLSEVGSSSSLPNSGLPCGPAVLSFQQAASLAATRDPDLMARGAALERSQIHLAQAKSERWPRLDVDVTVEAPIDEEVDEPITGGVYVRYDFLRAALSGAAMTRAEIVTRQRQLEAQWLHRSVEHDLLELMGRIDKERRQLDGELAAQDLINRALRLVDERPPGDRTAASYRRDWLFRERQHEQRRLGHQARLQVARFELHQLLGSPVSCQITIGDVESHLASPTAWPLDLQDDMLLTAWRSRGDLLAEQLQLLLAELNIEAAKRLRIPTPRIYLGLGNVPLILDNRTASVVPVFRLSFPLFDMGDARRQIKLAQTERDSVRHGLTARLRESNLSIRAAVGEAELAHARLLAAESWRAQEAQRAADAEALFSRHRIDELRLLESRLSALDADSDTQTALFEFRTSVSRVSRLLGSSPTTEPADESD